MSTLIRALGLRAQVSALAAPLSARGYATGTVKWFSTSKGYGFLQTDEESPKEVFVHQSAIKMEGYRYLAEGEKVSFDVQKTERGLQALNVTGVDGELQRENRPRPATSNHARRPRQNNADEQE